MRHSAIVAPERTLVPLCGPLEPEHEGPPRKSHPRPVGTEFGGARAIDEVVVVAVGTEPEGHRISGVGGGLFVSAPLQNSGALAKGVLSAGVRHAYIWLFL